MSLFFAFLGVLTLALALSGLVWRSGVASLFFLLAFLAHVYERGALLASPYQVAMLAAAFLAGFGRYYGRRPRLGAWVRALDAAALLVALLSLHYYDRVSVEALGPVVWFHAAVFLAAYVLLTLAFLAAWLGFLQHRRLKTVPWKALEAPPLLTLARLEEPYLRAGYVFYTLGLFSGMAWAFRVWGEPLSWDAKEVLTLLAWVFFTLLFFVREPGLRRWVWTAGYLTALAAFLLAPLFGTRHPV